MRESLLFDSGWTQSIYSPGSFFPSLLAVPRGSDPLEDLGRHRSLGLTPECLIQQVWGKDPKFALLCCSHF